MHVRNRSPRSAFVLLIAATAACDDGCGNQRLEELIAPGGERQATVFVRDCGATTAVSTQVTISARGGQASGTGNAFIADAGAGAAPIGPGGGPLVHVAWQAPDSLTIRHHPRVRIFKAETQHGAVHIRYVPDSTFESQPDA